MGLSFNWAINAKDMTHLCDCETEFSYILNLQRNVKYWFHISWTPQTDRGSENGLLCGERGRFVKRFPQRDLLSCPVPYPAQVGRNGVPSTSPPTQQERLPWGCLESLPAVSVTYGYETNHYKSQCLQMTIIIVLFILLHLGQAQCGQFVYSAWCQHQSDSVICLASWR